MVTLRGLKLRAEAMAILLGLAGASIVALAQAQPAARGCPYADEPAPHVQVYEVELATAEGPEPALPEACERAYSTVDSSAPAQEEIARECRALGVVCDASAIVPIETAICVAEETRLGEGMANDAHLSVDREGLLVWTIESREDASAVKIDAFTADLVEE